MQNAKFLSITFMIIVQKLPAEYENEMTINVRHEDSKTIKFCALVLEKLLLLKSCKSYKMDRSDAIFGGLH